MTITAGTELQTLSDRLRPKLVALYGTDAPRALAAVLEACSRHGSPPLVPRAWNERDAMVIAYADHVQHPGAAPLASLRSFVLDTGLDEVFSLLHLLPFFPSSSDDGFSIVDYEEVAPELGTWADVHALAEHIELGVDLVLNHASRSSAWFRAYLEGRAPERWFFKEADPGDDLSAVVRPRTSPVLTAVETSRGVRHVWATFSADQMDLDYGEPRLLAAVIDVLLSYADRGARVIRLDAVAFLWKEAGTPCVHHPNTHLVVQILRDVVDAVAPGTWLLTETNVPHRENVSYWGAGDEAHLVYNFAFPPLLLDALLTNDATYLQLWLHDAPDPPPGTTLVNFTASHDGIGLRAVEDLLPRERVAHLVRAVERRGGLVSRRSGPGGRAVPYELNITYFDALADPDRPDRWSHARRFVLSQALAMALRGIPAVYLSSLVAAPNDLAGVAATGQARSINRRRFTRRELEDGPSMARLVFEEYRRLLALRGAEQAFHPDGRQDPVDLGDRGWIGFLRTSPDGCRRVLVAANAGAETFDLDLRDVGLLPAGPDLNSGRRVDVGRPIVRLGPYEFAWLPVTPSSPSSP